MNDAGTPELWGAADVASFLKVTTVTLSRWHSGGKIPEGKRVGPQLRWEKAEILAWFKAGCPDRPKWESMQNTTAGR